MVLELTVCERKLASNQMGSTKNNRPLHYCYYTGQPKGGKKLGQSFHYKDGRYFEQWDCFREAGGSTHNGKQELIPKQQQGKNL